MKQMENNQNNNDDANHDRLPLLEGEHANRPNTTEEEKEIQNLGHIYKVRKLKSLEGIKVQQEKINQWLIEDKAYLKLNVSIGNLSQFVSGDFEVKEENNLKEITQINEWNKIESKTETTDTTKKSKSINRTHTEDDSPVQQQQNIILKNKLIKLNENIISLRSLSLQCEVNILMSGESNFYIFSRCGDAITNTTAVCYISKELESARKFVSFAILEPKEGNKSTFIIRNIKKQEIPRQENYIKALDISEIKFTFVDNGDNRCFVFLEEQEQNSNLVFIGDFYIPCTQKSNVMFGVTGDLISIKKLRIKQTIRNSYINLRSSRGNGANIQSCNCCIIF